MGASLLALGKSVYIYICSTVLHFTLIEKCWTDDFSCDNFLFFFFQQRGYNFVVLDRKGNVTDFRAFDFHAYLNADD